MVKVDAEFIIKLAHKVTSLEKNLNAFDKELDEIFRRVSKLQDAEARRRMIKINNLKDLTGWVEKIGNKDV